MIDTQYEDLLEYVLENGEEKPDRTGTGTYSIFGAQLRYDLQKGFPLITTKRVHFPSVVGELLWFISGSTNTNDLRDKYGVTIWDEWGTEFGNLGPMYGAQWRDWGGHDVWDDPSDTLKYNKGVDQIAEVIKSIRNDPHSRRHIVSAWNVADLPHMALAPCHTMFQFYVSADGKRLSCHLFQRSADIFLGVPFNIASYALLTHIIAAQCGLEVGEFLWSATDVHLYKNHEHQAVEQLDRNIMPLPKLWKLPVRLELDKYLPENFGVDNYNPHASIPAPVAV